ncbi:MAG TPA: hypothetical protein VFA94_12995 [Acidimicrobiales bacterium]|nr:hypothetical protein [Acidimicrobiales bacterium]
MIPYEMSGSRGARGGRAEPLNMGLSLSLVGLVLALAALLLVRVGGEPR